MRYFKLAIFSAILLAIAGCAGKSNLAPPAPLVKFSPKITIKQVWKADAGSSAVKKQIVIHPIHDRENIYATDIKGQVTAYSLNQGKQVWRVSLKSPISGAVGQDQRSIYIGSKKGVVFSLDKQNGKVRWRSVVSSEILAPPAAALGIVVVQTIDGRLHGLNANDGKRLWIRHWTVPVLSLRGTSHPLIIRNIVLTGFANGKIAVLDSRSGRLLREFVVTIPHGSNELERIVDVDAPPIIIRSRLFAAGYNGNVIAIDMTNGRILWRKKVSTYTGITGDNQNIYISDERGHVTAMNQNTGAIIWKQKQLHDRILNAPAMMGEYIVVGDVQGYLHWLSREDGSFVGRYKVAGSAVKAKMFTYQQTLYVGDQGGGIAALAIN